MTKRGSKCLHLQIPVCGFGHIPPISIYVCEGTPKSRPRCDFYEALSGAGSECKFYDADMGKHYREGGFCTRAEAQLVAHE